MNWKSEVSYSQVNETFIIFFKNDIKIEIRGVFIDVPVSKMLLRRYFVDIINIYNQLTLSKGDYIIMWVGFICSV